MINKARKFIEDVNTEMRKVIWPERPELINSTTVVIIVSILFTVFIFLTDTVVSKLINFLY